MKKIIVYTEEIKKKGTKLQFQIKLPETVTQVRGILATITRVPDAAQSPINPLDINTGSLWLRIAENRDVFFADIPEQSNHINVDLIGLEKVGQSMLAEWWFSGTEQKFFDITVPVEDLLIEGYYADESRFAAVNYKLRIYLELYLND